jgi:hypothetical protein
MATIQEDILEEFYKRLAEAEGFTEEKVEQFRAVFSSGKKSKAVDVIKALSENSQETLP